MDEQKIVSLSQNMTTETDDHQLLFDENSTVILNHFVENSTDAIVFFTNQGQLLRMNPACEQMFGWTQRQLVGTHYLELPWIPDDEKEKAHERFITVLRGINLQKQETKRITRTGDLLSVLQSVTPVLPSGFYAVTMKDITEWQATRELLSQREKLTIAGQLAAGIAHEIRNPLTTLKGFLQLIPTTNDPQRYIHIMQDELTRIEFIVSELLVLAKPQAIQFSTRDIRRKLRAVLYLLTAQATMKSIKLCTEFDTDIPDIECEPNQLKQVFINIIKNAIEATGTGGTVTVELKSLNDRHLLVRVRDTGPGIPEETLAQLGSPFFTTKETGTGLGLMMSKKIISNHHGTLEFTSAIGKGTTVSVVLPCKQPQRN